MAALDEKLRWLETRIASSLRPRNEELKNMFTNDENRLAFHEFTQNEDVRRLFIFLSPGPSKEIVASLQPPHNLKTKSIFFLKTNSGVKLTNENMDDEVLYLDCTSLPLEHLDLMAREVFLPFLCTNQAVTDTSGANADKLMDVLHRLMATVEVTQGQIEGRIVLSLPSVEVLAEAAASSNRRASVLHVLETTVIGWIRQIKVVLRHEPISDLYNKFGPEPGPLNEVEMWEAQLSRLRSVNQQLDTPIAKDILMNLEQANSQYAHSFSQVRKEINKAVFDTQKVLRFLSTMSPWFEALHRAMVPHSMVTTLKPLMTVLTLVWTHSKYYHQMNKFNNLLRLISNEVVHRAQAMVGDDILREPLQSYSKLKDALRVCAAFRGTYLDFKDKADDINAKTIAENEEKHHSQEQGSLFKARLYGPHAYVPRFGLRHGDSGASNSSLGEDDLWTDSPWPPRNAPCFVLLNSFMERCNDVLELVETTRHFRLLEGAAEIGGAGTLSLDALVKEIHKKYQVAMGEFFSVVDNVLSIDGSQAFEKAFFRFRTVVKMLERQLSEILRQAFQQCHTIGAQLRLLEVFEGISGRELVQTHLKDKDSLLVESFTIELECVRNMFLQQRRRPPQHYNMPPVVSRLMWAHALTDRVKLPMEKMRMVSPHSLEGDRGWSMKDTYDDLVRDLIGYQTELISSWKSNLTSELSGRLKQPLLIAEEYDEELEIRPQAIHVNLDLKLLLLMKEVHYLRREPFSIKLPETVKELIRNTDAYQLRVTATRLETIVSKYNTVMKTITDYERPLFERKLNKVDQLFEQGLNQYTWKMKESVDFIETAMALVCLDVHQNLDIVQTNCHEVAEITISWSKGTLDIFRARDHTRSYPMEELMQLQNSLNEDLEGVVAPSGIKIHNLVQRSFEAVEISQASPAWRDYVDYMDAIVLDGLKQSTLTSLKSMLNTLVMANTARSSSLIPILTIRLELIENRVAFRPPLDQLTSVTSVQELVSQWLQQFLARGKLVNMLGNKGSYQDYISVDEEVQRLLAHVNKLVEDNSEECKGLYSLFRDFDFLWLQDVNQTFEEFLNGKLPLHLRQGGGDCPSEDVPYQSPIHRFPTGYPMEPDPAERSFLTPKHSSMGPETSIPTLDEFDQEIDIYKGARDQIVDMPEHRDVGWLRVDLRPIKQVLTTYASKWMWTFTKYLSDQVSMMLDNLDIFLKRIEPEIESITGEERDTASFMKMMRLFNEVSAQQAEMDGKFSVMNRTVTLLKKYGQALSEQTEGLFMAAPSRWSNLKTKVSLAKQRLGPRIQEESARITKDLEAFGDRVLQLSCDLENSDVYNRDCSIPQAWDVIDGFVRQLNILENEAQDLIELQELLETSVVNFEILPECRHDLNNLKQMWETTRVIDEQQAGWKRKRWQKMDTKFLKEECQKQLDIVKALPEDAFTWDVYMGLHESVTTIQACLPLIDDLSNPAMRTRHWKQLVRVTGGALTIDNDTLKRMTLGELLGLGLQKHVDDVRGIVQRAVKDMSIEKSLKNYEEVWLSKIFETRDHVARKTESLDIHIDNHSEISQSVDGSHQPSLLNNRSGRATSRVSNQSSHSRNKRSSVASLPGSLLNLGEEQGPLVLLHNTGPIFEDLENHQVSLQAMQSNSAAGSFLDEVVKWQKRLQNIEAVLTLWLEVQEKWVELEDVYSGQDIRISMPHEANTFAQVNRDFSLLMRASEKNPNVLQCCSRKNILPILEHMNRSLEACHRALLKDLERRRQIFPRFYFLSMEDVLHIICNGYDLHQVNVYISKLFENVGSLVFEDMDEHDKCNFQITGVNSRLGERLEFRQPVACEGQIETWLTSFIQALRTALQFQVATAMGVEKPPPKSLQYQPSVPARRAQPPKGVRSLDKKTKDKGSSRASSRQALSRQGTRADLPQRSVTLVPQPTPEPVADATPRSWTLEHVAEVVYLATRVQLTELIEEGLRGLEAGDRDAMQVPLEKINSSIKATTQQLKGLGDERESRRQKDQDAEGDVDGRESGSLVAGRQGSIRGSGFDLTNEGTHTPIPEERDPQQQEAHEEDKTDTMTLTPTAQPLPLEPQQAASGTVVSGGEGERSGAKLMLFPGQIQKLSCLLAVLAHLRDLVHRILTSPSTEKPSESFHWQAQLLYRYNKDSRAVNISCFGSEFEYGWEYQGSGYREVITPDTERVFVTMTQAIKAKMGTLCVGPTESGRFELIHELTRCLGHPLYTFNCGVKMDHLMLHDIFRGLASTGSWVCFEGLNRLSPAVLSVFAQLMATVLEAVRAGKAAVRLGSEDIQLSPNGACFSLLESAVPLQPYNPDKQLLFRSALAHLPDNVLTQFRTVSVIQPDLRLSVEALLLGQGFENGQELAHKTIQLHTMCKAMLGTNVIIRDTVSLGTLTGAQGWSLQTLKYMVFEAGAQLDLLLSEQQTPGDVYAKLALLDESVDEEREEEARQSAAPLSKIQLEDNAVVTALRNTYMPRLQHRDASIFTSLLVDLWPDSDVPLEVVGQSEGREQETLASMNTKYRIKSPKSTVSHSSLKDMVHLNTPVVRMSSVLTGPMAGGSNAQTGSRDTLADMTDAIAVATSELSLLPGVAFQARVLQLSQMNASHQSVFVVGPAGCGKSECIKTFAVAERERGKTIDVQSVFTKALESEELMGHTDPNTKQWKDGLLTSLLRKCCVQPAAMEAYDTVVRPVMRVLQLDGDVDPGQMELLQSVFHNDGMVVLGNNERISLSENIRFIWEMESLSHVSPSVLCNVGVLVMTEQDVGWKLMLMQWLQRRPEADKDLIMGLCDVYIPPTLAYLDQCTAPPMFGASQASGLPQYKRVIPHTNENMISTFCSILETLVAPYPHLSDVEFERYFNLACIWSFAGTLAVEHRESFSHWWREQFDHFVDYPEDGMVFDYVVDNESHMFVNWVDLLPTYSGTPHQGIPPEAFVHTVYNEQIAQLLGLLSDVGKPVLLVGENGCGKTSIVKERIRSVCSGEVAEVLALNIPANTFTNARLLYDRLDERLEWKHGRTFVPKGNKRLMCLVDDLNLAQVDKFGFQTAPEMIRQHLDDGGFYNPVSHTWRYVKNVTYVSTVNPNTTASVPRLCKRLLRHFAIFGVPYPSGQELQTIFSTLLHTHFITPDLPGGALAASPANYLGLHDDKVHNIMRVVEAALKMAIQVVVKVTVELQERLCGMFLPTSQRCHYIFTMRDLGTIFKNMCLSLTKGCSISKLLCLWQHECHWVYGRRMVSEVDYRRFRQAFSTAVKKEFTREDQVQMVIQPRQPLFSNLMEQDSGVVTAGRTNSRPNTTSRGEETDPTDLYRPSPSWQDVMVLMERGVEEYNKVHPRIKLSLYTSVIEEVCRLSRMIASPHEVAHMVLVSEGCAGRCLTIVQLSAHLCGFSVVRINPSSMASAADYRIEQFKADLVSGYTRAGVKGERVLLLIHEEELLDEDFLVYLIEFIISGNISYLFSPEDQTTIINSIRTEVTQAGLTYTRDVAWDFFLRTVRNNFRICVIVGSGGARFQRRCREYPSFTKNINFIWLPHWSKVQLVDHALYHLNDVAWMTDVQRENIAHMLASMHIVLRQQDGQERNSGEYQHITNATYEKFVERYISLSDNRHAEIEEIQKAVTMSLNEISRENDIASKLGKQLEHEMIVLEERKAGTIKILSQIGQDTAITEQQVKVVKAQMDKIARLKKLLPEYQVAHERAVYKAIAIVADTKKLVQNIDVDMMAELRSMQKPIIEIEDLMAAIIMLLKSPSADLTWQKGAKRQMANLERFIEELMSFDDEQLPESTLNLVEPYLKKPSFDPAVMERKTSNAACGSLCRWVTGVVRYHRMMISKVKPLHQKVDETTQAVDDAEHKMATLENKRKALEVRLLDLARGFEEATIDKNDQEDKTLKMSKMLETTAQLRRILKGERMRSQQIFDSYERRLVAIPGGCVMAAAFVTYLGPYHHNFRRMMLTVHWPNCLRERGIPLVIDSIDGLKGRVVDWSISGLRTASGASSVYGMDYPALSPDNTITEGDEDNMPPESEPTEVLEGENPGTGMVQDQGETTEQSGETMSAEAPDNSGGVPDADQSVGPNGGALEGGLDQIDEEGGEGSVSQPPSDSSAPIISTLQYNLYVRSLVKLLMGEKTLDTWITKDYGCHHMENAAMLCSSWQRPPMLIDPNGDGVKWLTQLNHFVSQTKLVILDMENRTDPHVLLTLEKAILRGKHVLLKNCSEQIDNVVSPLIHHSCTGDSQQGSEPRMIRFCERRVLCHPDFRLFMSTALAKPKFSPEIASTTTLVNYGVSHDTLIEDILTRAFALIRPVLYGERKIALTNVQLQRSTLFTIAEMTKNKVMSLDQSKSLSRGGRELQLITDIRNTKVDIATRLSETKLILQELDILRDELFPLARRAAVLYAVLRSMACVHREYQFTLTYFMSLFDEAIGGELPANFTEFMAETQSTEVIEDNSTVDAEENIRPYSAISVPHAANKGETQVGTEGYDDDFENSSSVRQEKSDNPDTTDESASTEAAQRLLAASESLELTTVDIPDMTTLPSDGVEYSSMSANQIKQLSDKLTALVFQRVRQCLYEEDSLLFATMMCLNIQAEAGQSFTEEEMSLLLQGNPGLGMQLSLLDFDCEADPPAWLHQEKWEDMLAISVLPGPLDSLCAKMAVNSEAWEAWYKSAYPETEPIPLPPASQDQPPVSVDREGESSSPDLGNLTDFHQLLIIRMLRPDRLPAAMLRYVNKHLHLNLTEGPVFRLADVLTDASRHQGVLLLLSPCPSHPKFHPASQLSMTQSPLALLKKLALQSSVNVESMKIGEGCEVLVADAIESAEKNDGWLVIENLHLASDSFISALKYQLRRVEKTRAGLPDEKRRSLKFCVFVTSEPCERIPLYLLQKLHLLAWDKLNVSELQPSASSELLSPALSSYTCPKDCLHTAISSTLRLVPDDLWIQVRDEGQFSKAAAFGVAVVQAVLQARQLFGAAGLTQWYPLNGVQICQAISLLTHGNLRQENHADRLAAILSQVVYCNVMLSLADEDYVRALIYHVMSQLRVNTSGKLRLGSAVIPTPPANVDPVDYANWYEEQTANNSQSSLQALSIHSSVEKEANEASSTEFVCHLDHMFETQNLEAGDLITMTEDKAVNIKRLRSSLDICVEQLPPLLELGAVPSPVGEDYDFPYHRPSILSVGSVSSTLMPESIGYVLLQECLWFNSVLCHIRQQVEDMQSVILGGPEAYAASLLPTVYSLQEEQIPISWVHPNLQPCTHSLLSWLADLRERYDQLYRWVKQGMVPTFRQDGENGLISRGSLHQVWLGGLVNPQALFTAIRQEKAYVAKCSIHQVVFSTEVVESSDLDAVSQLQEGGILVQNAHLLGAGWDDQANCLQDARSSVHTIKQLYVWPVIEGESGTNAEDVGESSNYYQCPVYMNKSRQVEVAFLPLRCPGDSNKWLLSSTAIVLDLGLPEDSCKKSRSYLMLQKLPANSGLESMPGTARTSEMGEEDIYGFGNYKEGTESKASVTQLSEQSQLSYKPMTPKALPLPTGLGLSREQPLIEEAHIHKDGADSQKADGSQYGSSQASLQRGQRPQSNEKTSSKNSLTKENFNQNRVESESQIQTSRQQTGSPNYDVSPAKTPSPKPPSEPRKNSPGAYRSSSRVSRVSQDKYLKSSQESLNKRDSPEGFKPDNPPSPGSPDVASPERREDDTDSVEDAQNPDEDRLSRTSAVSGTQGQFDFENDDRTENNTQDKNQDETNSKPARPPNTMKALDDSDDDLFGDLPSYQPTLG